MDQVYGFACLVRGKPQCNEVLNIPYIIPCYIDPRYIEILDTTIFFLIPLRFNISRCDCTRIARENFRSISSSCPAPVNHCCSCQVNDPLPIKLWYSSSGETNNSLCCQHLVAWHQNWCVQILATLNKKLVLCTSEN